MGNAGDRSGLALSRLLFCFMGLAIIAACIGLAMTAVGVTERRSDPRGSASILRERASAPKSADGEAASSANGHFAIDLYQRLAESEPGDNIFLSPFSISTVLTMTAEGAVNQTLDQMLKVLHVPTGGLEQIHRGQRELQSAVVPVVPPELFEKIETLRARLKDTNERTLALKKADRFQEFRESWVSGTKLAEEINALMNQISAYELKIANALWLEKSYPVEPGFISAMTPYYGMILFPVDFQDRPEPMRIQINEWVAQHTNDRIQNLLCPGSITDQTKLVLTNTVYFRGDWAEPFDASRTKSEPFRLSNEDSIKLLMMHQWNAKTASYAAFESSGDLFPTPREVRVDIKDDNPSLYPDARGHTMLALDYQGHKIQMILLVPQSATGISDLEKSLSYEGLERWIGQLQQRTVNLSIPKFKLESTYHLQETLRTLGMVRAFENPNDAEGAQFDKLVSTRQSDDRFCISDVVHKTYVDVSEVGTEAAAATALDTVSDFGPDDSAKMVPFVPIFKASRPFIFLIRDRDTASILFLGRYAGKSAPQ